MISLPSILEDSADTGIEWPRFLLISSSSLPNTCTLYVVHLNFYNNLRNLKLHLLNFKWILSKSVTCQSQVRSFSFVNKVDSNYWYTQRMNSPLYFINRITSMIPVGDSITICLRVARCGHDELNESRPCYTTKKLMKLFCQWTKLDSHYHERQILSVENSVINFSLRTEISRDMEQHLEVKSKVLKRHAPRGEISHCSGRRENAILSSLFVTMFVQIELWEQEGAKFSFFHQTSQKLGNIHMPSN